MRDTLLLGVGRFLVPVPRPVWQAQVRGGADLAFMSADHHRVRDYVVRELPLVGHPLPPEMIAVALQLPVVRVTAILEELEKRMTFVYRDEQGAVVWAYPVTAADTPHHIRFSTGEQVHAA